MQTRGRTSAAAFGAAAGAFAQAIRAGMNGERTPSTFEFASWIVGGAVLGVVANEMFG